MIEDDVHIIQNDPLIVVDKFPYTKKREAIAEKEIEKKAIKKIYFLTHFHADHYMKINKYFNENVFSSGITKKLLMNIIGVREKYVHNLKINKHYYLFNFDIVFIDANHCPGSVIIYFEFANGTKIIHTGDFRYSNVHTFLIKKVLNCGSIKKEEKWDKGENLHNNLLRFNKKISTEGKINNYICWNNKVYHNCYETENFYIYDEDTYIIDMEEFRMVYLKNVEDSLLNLEHMEKEFYFYDSIETENYFNFFIFIELSLYFNQNEIDIILLHGDESILNGNVIINRENVKDIRFVVRSHDKEEAVKNPPLCSTIFSKEDVPHGMDKNEWNNVNFKSEKEFDNAVNYEHVRTKREKGNDNCGNKEHNDVLIDQAEMKTKKERKHTSNGALKREKNHDVHKINGKIHPNKSEENCNYIRTIYLDTTYALCKNNLFAPQMYLINFIIYLCKKKVKQNCGLEIDQNVVDHLAKVGKSGDIVKKTVDSKGQNKKEGGDVSSEPMLSMKKTLFMFGTYNLGKEKIYLSVSEACNMKIYFKNEKKRTIIESFLCNKNILKRITDNKLEAQIHIVDINYSFIFPKIDKNKFRNLIDADIEKEFDSFYYIIPTGWVSKYSFYEKNNISIFLIPYSEHSNLRELKDFVKSVKPCNILPTVFSNLKEKEKILDMFNPYLNLKREVYNLLKIEESCIVRNKRTLKSGNSGEENDGSGSKQKEVKKKCLRSKTKAEKIATDKNQQKLTSFFSLTKKGAIKREKR
ncbi:DNA repair metallo-beta-lactamase protein, putative [Plasmodium ovale wallikeri]|uniref:DNA repair metallo-beta-lactamase protein, putative n=2 Tax=Plasmodium ovale TaxID=36330 RepID=A0A1A8ZIT8_PLAOA|nr:DNA repair metallo-beta-lactamase protein, putative [Plasmodium ovale wallikeri]SBT44273.1 DNA repair metallo-beta-lactamase protein, putative [Plasmodium ovale wallikeri]SBT78538.1 DNA repair metallo-beta-lactamase protein, putative [Plasmodium ovale]